MADLSKPAEATLHHLSAGKPGAPTQQTLQRRQREHITSKVDGRHLRAKGRTVAVNYKVTPAFKEDLYALAKRLNKPMVDVLEEALALYKKSLPKEG